MNVPTSKLLGVPATSGSFLKLASNLAVSPQWRSFNNIHDFAQLIGEVVSLYSEDNNTNEGTVKLIRIKFSSEFQNWTLILLIGRWRK